MSSAYSYDYSIEIIVTFPVEGQVSLDEERYLFINIFTFSSKILGLFSLFGGLISTFKWEKSVHLLFCFLYVFFQFHTKGYYRILYTWDI